MALKVALFGATGSIGTQTLEVIDEFPDLFQVSLLVGRTNVDRLSQLSEKYGGCAFYSPFLESVPVNFLDEKLHDADIMVYAASTVDYLKELVSFLSSGKPVCLSTKEVVVEAWPLIEPYSNLIRPVDSEHNALWRLGAKDGGIKHLYVVGTGGSLRDKSQDQILNAGMDEVLMHPVWKMGPKVTFDSAFLINKSMEVIEAAHLFDLSMEQIEIVIERSGYVHGVVDKVDGTRFILTSEPTMKIPIAYALSYPNLLPVETSHVMPVTDTSFSFEVPDKDRFPWVSLGHEALSCSYTSRMAFSVADQIAFELFQNGKIKPLAIYELLANAINLYAHEEYPTSIDDYFELRKDMRSRLIEEVKRF
jgi:1-deoxy-D-xylulose-5-phosphate reductoisomerase